MNITDLAKSIIVLSNKGFYLAWVDVEDFELINQYNWYPKFCDTMLYAGTKTNVYMHRLIMRAKKGEEVDHKDRDGLNNRRSNLRIATSSQNNMNKLKPGFGTSIYKGVCWDKARNKWQVMVGKLHLGRFNDEIEAAKAYDKKAKELFGEFARLNFQND